MNQESKQKLLRISLLGIGVIFIAGIWILGQVWPSGWSWHTSGRSHYYEMILAVYATLASSSFWHPRSRKSTAA